MPSTLLRLTTTSGALITNRPVTCLASITVPATLTVIGPEYVDSATPSGTPVFPAPGKPPREIEPAVTTGRTRNRRSASAVAGN